MPANICSFCLVLLGPLGGLAVSGELKKFAAQEVRFTDATAVVGLEEALTAAFIHAIAWGDFDGDGKLDLFLGTFSDRNAKPYGRDKAPLHMLFRQTKGGKFERFPCPAVELPARCSGAVFVDLDNDGDLDLYVSSNRWDKPSPDESRRLARDQGCRLYRNDGGGKFVDVSETCGACPPTLFYCRDIGVFDYDGDGLLDLLVLQDTAIRRDGKTHGSRLFRNRGKFRFEDVTAQAGLPEDLWGFGIAVADVSGDGRPDFFVCGSDRLYLSQPNGTYREAATLRDVFDHGGKDLDRVTGAAFGDLDRDGDLDLITGPHNYHAPSRIHVFLNEGLGGGIPRFRKITGDLSIPAMPQKAPHPEIQDFDNDGLPDLYWSSWFAEGGARRPFLCKGLGVRDGLPRFAVPGVPAFSEEMLKKNAPPAGKPGMVYYVCGPAVDYDGDGDLDILAGNWPPEGSRFFRNDTKGGNWLQVRVEGKNMNRMGVGTQVRVYAAGKGGEPSALLGLQEITLNGGYSSSRPAIAHFGVGKVDVCDVQVTLPSRKEPLVSRRVKANQRILIVERARSQGE